MPVRAAVSCPVELVPGYKSNLLCRAQNLLSVDVAPELTANITSTSGGQSVSQTFPLTLKGKERSNIILPITQSLVPGEYVLSLSLAWGTMKENLHDGWVTVLPDEDGDGMPTTWENLEGLDAFQDDAAKDNDRDGSTNYEEFIAQTNPTDGDSILGPPSIEGSAETGGLQLRWHGAPARIYEVEWSEDMAAWQKAEGQGAVQVGRDRSLGFADGDLGKTGESNGSSATASVRKRFYRIAIHIR